MKMRLLLEMGLVLAAVFVIGASRVRQDVMTLTVVERATNDTVTDLGDEGDSVGDILTFANILYDENNETEVGADNGYCLRTVVGQAWECNWTAIFEDGTITVEGPFLDTGDSVLAITGGTGAYANAGGQMTLHWRTDDGTEYDFIYEIAGNM